VPRRTGDIGPSAGGIPAVTAWSVLKAGRVDESRVLIDGELRACMGSND